MIKIYSSSEDGVLNQVNSFAKGCWVNLVNPTEEELQSIMEGLNIIPDFLKYTLDLEEKARIEMDEGQTLIIVDVPVLDVEEDAVIYETIPISIIITEDYIVTTCLKKNSIIRDFEKSRIKTFYSFKRTRFVFQLLLKVAAYYLKYLKQINKETDQIEKQLHKSMKNQELFALLNVQKSLVYFTTSLKANEVVMEKLMRGNILKMYEEDQDILEDVIIENKQAIEMATTYSSILTGMMNTFASVISNNVNIVMKLLTSITIVLSLPIMVASFYGMNVSLPLENYPHAFTITIVISLLISSITAYIFAKMKFF